MPAELRSRSIHPPILRLAAVCLLVACEIVLLSVFFDTAALRGRSQIAALVDKWAPVLVNGAVVFAFAFCVLGMRHIVEVLRREPPAYTGRHMAFLLAHLGGTAIFAALSAALFASDSTAAASDAYTALWLLAGTLSFAVAPLAAVRTTAIRGLLHVGWPVWTYSAAVAAAACAITQLNERLWTGSVALTFAVVRAVLHPLIPGLAADPATGHIGTEAFSVIINPECSGIEGVGLMLSFSTAWLLYHRGECRFPHALAIIPASVSAVWVLNAIRITTLILIGNAGAAAVAAGGFHSQAGWIGFNAVAIAILAFGRRVPWIRMAPRSAASAEHNPVTPYLLPFVSIMAAGMVAQALSDGRFEGLYPLRVAAAAVALLLFADRYKSMDWRFGWRAVAIGAGVFLLWMALAPAGSAENTNALRDSMASLPPWAAFGWIAVRVIGAVVTVPVAEELAFRGFLMRRLISADFDAVPPRAWTYVSIGASSVLFGLLHGEEWLGGIVAGLAYAAAFVGRGRIGDAVVAHGTTNALIAVAVLVGGRWDLW